MKRLAFVAPLVLAGALAACGGEIDAPETARLTILLTDAPGDVTSAVVTISSIYLQGGADDDTDDPISRVVLMDEPVTTDLLTLVDDVETLVEGATIAAGTYGQLRFVIDGAYIVVETDTGEAVYATAGYEEAPAQVDGILICPSCAQSGIKVRLQGLTIGDADETVVVDFDVEESFGHQAGSSGNWVMQPSLKASPLAAPAGS